jgi:DNA-binding IclR family transcriptional regulator
MQSDPAHGRDDELVEKVARELAYAMGMDPDEVQTNGENEWPLWAEFQKPARAALAVARPAIREECAKVAEEVRHPDYSAENEDWCAGTEAAAAAIRAME